MSDPTERHKAEPHPVSAHRTPHEIAEDEAGPIGDATKGDQKTIHADQGPVRKLDESIEEEKPRSKPENEMDRKSKPAI
jgi:hypothetical protein